MIISLIILISLIIPQGIIRIIENNEQNWEVGYV